MIEREQVRQWLKNTGKQLNRINQIKYSGIHTNLMVHCYISANMNDIPDSRNYINHQKFDIYELENKVC